MTGFLRRNWLWCGFAVLLTGLAVNIAVRDGIVPLLVIAAVTAGGFAVPAVVALLSGNRVGKHAKAYRRQLPRVADEIRILETSRGKDHQQ